MPIEGLKEVQIGPRAPSSTKIDTSLSTRGERELVDQLQRNVNLFVLTLSNMRGINANVVTHHLTIHPSTKPVAQRKQKVGEEKRATIDEELKNLSSARFITKI